MVHITGCKNKYDFNLVYLILIIFNILNFEFFNYKR